MSWSATSLTVIGHRVWVFFFAPCAWYLVCRSVLNLSLLLHLSRFSLFALQPPLFSLLPYDAAVFISFIFFLSSLTKLFSKFNSQISNHTKLISAMTYPHFGLRDLPTLEMVAILPPHTLASLSGILATSPMPATCCRPHPPPMPFITVPLSFQVSLSLSHLFPHLTANHTTPHSLSLSLSLKKHFPINNHVHIHIYISIYFKEHDEKAY